MIFVVKLFCYPWACPQLVHDFIVLVYADLLYGNFVEFLELKSIVCQMLKQKEE